MQDGIHPTAIIADGARLGEEVSVGPYSVIGPHVEIGDRCRVGSHVVIEGHTTVGADCSVFQFCSIGSAPQDLKYKGEPSTLSIGERNVIREYVTLQPGTATGTMKTVIGDDNLFMVCSHVGHDSRVGSGNVFANSVALAGHVSVGDSVTLGGLTGVHQFVRIGDLAFLSGGSMVIEDIPPYCFVQGDRAKLRGINVVGLQRSGLDAEAIADIKKVYRTLFGSLGNPIERLTELPEEFKARPHVNRFTSFLTASDRGVCKPAKSLAKE